MCKGCKHLRAFRGTTNPSGPIDRWAKIIARGIERRDKGVLTDSDVDDAAKLVKIAEKYLAPKGRKLREEAIAQVAYAKHMSKFSQQLKDTKYQTIGDNSVPGMKVLFEQAADLCERNPKFEGSLIVALFKAAVAKEKFGKNARTKEMVTNFYRYVNTYNPKAAEVVSANLGGPGILYVAQ